MIPKSGWLIRLILRFHCWRYGVCYIHAETKESDGYGPPQCESCYSLKFDKKKEYDHEVRMWLIRELHKWR